MDANCQRPHSEIPLTVTHYYFLLLPIATNLLYQKSLGFVYLKIYIFLISFQ